MIAFSIFVFFFQAEDGIRDLVRSRGLGDVYKRQEQIVNLEKKEELVKRVQEFKLSGTAEEDLKSLKACLLYTSDAAEERSSVDLGGRRIIKKKKEEDTQGERLQCKNQIHTHKK